MKPITIIVLFLATLFLQQLSYSDEPSLKDAESLAKKAEALCEEGKHKEAIPYAQNALKIREGILEKEHPDLASSLSQLADIYDGMGNYKDAESLYKRAIEIREKALGPDHPDVAKTLSGLAWVYNALNNNEKAEALFKRAIEIQEKTLGPDHQDVGFSLNGLAELYRSINVYEKAEPLHKRALEIREKALGPDHQDVAASLNNLANVYESLGVYEKAETLFKRAIEIQEKTLGPEHPDVAHCLGNLAQVYYKLGVYKEAESLDKRALEIREKALGPEHPAVAYSLSNLARGYYKLGAYEKAEPLYKRALAIREKAFGPEHPRVAENLNSLANVYYLSEACEKAEPLYKKALAIWEKALGPENLQVSFGLGNLANTYSKLGAYKKAEPLYKRIFDIQEKALGPDHPEVATSLNNLALLYRDLGAYEKAEPLHKRSLAIREKALGPDHPDVAQSLNGLAELYYFLGAYEKAEPLHKRALEIREKALGPDHPDVARSLGNLADLYCSLGAYEKAEPLLKHALSIAIVNKVPTILWLAQYSLCRFHYQQNHKEAAIYFGKQAVNIIQGLRGRISAMDKNLQDTFLKEKEPIYKYLANLLIDEGRLPEAQQVLSMLKEEEYFDFIRRDEGGEFKRTTTANYTLIEEPWVARYKEISNQLVDISMKERELRQKKNKGTLSSEEKLTLNNLEKDLEIAKKEFDKYIDELVLELSNNKKDVAKDIMSENFKSLEALKRTLKELGPGTVLIHYVMTEGKLRMILTAPDIIQFHRDYEITEKDLNRKITAFRETIEKSDTDPKPQAMELYEIIFGEIDNDLKDYQAKTIMVYLTDTLRYLPINALHNGEVYVAEMYRIVIFTEASKGNLNRNPVKWKTAAGMGCTRAFGKFKPLKNVQAELEGIIKNKRDENDKYGILSGEIYLDNDFTEDTFFDVLNNDIPVVHIASHFDLKPGRGLESALILGNKSELTLEQIRSGPSFSNVDLLTLSACNTAIGEPSSNGAEIEGFGALAQNKGASGVIATLWSVQDNSTSLFMQNMYRLHQKKKLSKAEALQKAQLLFIRDPKYAAYSHPYFWAPFILMGNWK